MLHYTSFFYFLSVFSFLFFAPNGLRAQNLKEPVGYLEYMAKPSREITKDYLSYSSAIARGKNARKVENRRNEMVQSIKEAIRTVSSMPAFKGDKSLRDSAVAYLKLSHHVMNEDFGKIVNLEEISEQSYDNMEAYLTAQDLANEKMNKAGERWSEMEKEFAKNHNIRLIENTDNLSKKLAQTNKVNAYYKPVYLIFFKSYKQEMYLLDALNSKDFNAIEQNKNSLKQFSEEGMAKLKVITSFNGDKSLVLACNQLLNFYQSQSADKIAVLTDFYLQEENFLKVKKAIEEKRDAERTQKDIDEYNKAVAEYNKQIKTFNTVNDELNRSRQKWLDNWNKESQAFLSKHTPR